MVSRSSYRESSSNSSLRSWESFCREEAREAASAFLDRVRRFKSRNVGARDVHDSTFTNEFSAAFLEESSNMLMADPGNRAENTSHSNSNGYTSVLVRSMPTTGRVRQEEPRTEVKSNASSSSRGGKTWWSNIFKWPKSRRERRSGTLGSSSSSSLGASGSQRVVIKEGAVQLLDFSDSLSWSPCKLALLEVQGNHQVEVFSPPKSSNPKMSLFCFLIEDVRSTTSLETPDSSSCFVIKTQNHGEYVFDAGKEQMKQQWIDTILSYSSQRFQQSNVQSNGHVPRTTVPNGRSRSISTGEIQANYIVRHSTLPRTVPPPPISQRTSGNTTTNEAPPNTSPPQVPSSSLNVEMGHGDSEESIMVDVSSFIRNHPYRSPNRQQRTQSMFVSSQVGVQVPSHPLHTQISPSHRSPTSSQPSARFPYASPHSSPPHTITPPPLPKRDNFRQRSQSVSQNSSGINHTPSSPNNIVPPKTNNERGEQVPKRQISQPFFDLSNASEPSTNNHELPTPGNLESCSQSSSSSALHPVSLAAVQRSIAAKGRRGSVSSTDATPQSSLFNAHHKSPRRHMRKISAPVLMAAEEVAKLQLENGIVKTRINGERRPRYASDNVLNNNGAASGGGSIDLSPREVEESDREIDESLSNLQDDPADYSSITTACQRGRPFSNDEANSHKWTMNFPHNSAATNRQPSPPTSQRRTPPQRDTSEGDSSAQQIEAILREARLDLGRSSDTGSPQPQLNQSRDGVQSQASIHTNPSTRTNSSSDETDSATRATPSPSGNPIFVEASELQSHPVVMHTQHPYQFWATREQDVVNLRVLSNYPWFHGMISRANASQLVLAGGDSGTGQYLVRQSESREGDFVLTFNYHDRAKHLRMTLDDSGCNIQHLWFDDVPSMLEYFKTNSIPLESFWLNDDVKLTTYIDRQASDSFRTTTVIHTDRLNRVPPRRSRSLHLGMSHSVASSTSPNTPLSSEPIEGDSSPASVSSSNSHSTNSLPHSTRHSTGWRQLFRSQRSSSAGNVGRIQRRHSTNVGSALSTTARSGGGTNRGGSRNSNSENTYILRHY